MTSSHTPVFGCCAAAAPGGADAHRGRPGRNVLQGPRQAGEGPCQEMWQRCSAVQGPSRHNVVAILIAAGHFLWQTGWRSNHRSALVSR